MQAFTILLMVLPMALMTFFPAASIFDMRQQFIWVPSQTEAVDAPLMQRRASTNSSSGSAAVVDNNALEQHFPPPENNNNNEDDDKEEIPAEGNPAPDLPEKVDDKNNNNQAVSTTTNNNSPTKRRLFLFWIKENPDLGDSGIFRYYYDIGHAIVSQGAGVEVCESTFQDKRNKLRASGADNSTWKSIWSITDEEQYDYLMACYQRAVEFEKTQGAEAILVPLFPTKWAREIHNDKGKFMKPFVKNLRRLLGDIGSMPPAAFAPAPSQVARNLAVMKKPCITFLFMANMVFNYLTPKMKEFRQPFVDQGLLKLSKYRWRPTVPGLNVIASTWSPLAKSFEKKHGIRFFFCPFGTDIGIFNLTGHPAAQTPWKDRPNDVFLRWDTHVRKYRYRREVQYLLGNNKATTPETERIGDVSDIVTLAPKGFMGETRYLSSIVKSKMAVSTIGIPDKADLLGTRHYEIQASGTTLLLSERPVTKPQIMGHHEYGFVENETFVGFASVTELIEKIRHYKAYPEEAERIIRNAQQQAVLHGSWFSRGTTYVTKIWEMSRACCGDGTKV